MTKSAHEKNYPLMEALQNEQEEMVVWLLQNNANVHVVDLGSNSILHLSAAVGNGHGIAASILQGVNMKLQNNAQETAIELADSEDAIRIFLGSDSIFWVSFNNKDAHVKGVYQNILHGVQSNK